MSKLGPADILAIDGGGTSCRFALVASGNRIDHFLGAANFSTDPDGTIATLKSGLAHLAAKMPGVDLAAIPGFVGLAGVMDDVDQERLRQGLELPLARIDDDRPAAVRGALGSGDGFVAGIGTGSFFARQQQGEMTFVGGWGFRLGDEASGAWLGRRLLSHVVRSVDGLSPTSPLTREVLARLGGAPQHVVRWSRTAETTDFAGLAPDIVGAAKKGDGVARELMAVGAAEIVQALVALGWTAADRLCLLGGVAPHYEQYLPAEIATAIHAPRGTALDGALGLARELATGQELAR